MLGDLDDVHGIEEQDEHFIIDHAKKGKFRIAKSAVSADVADSIRSVAKGKAAAAEALRNEAGADGVTHAATGDVVPDDIAAQAAEDARVRDDIAARRAAQANEVEADPEPGSAADLLDVNRVSTAAPFVPNAPVAPSAPALPYPAADLARMGLSPEQVQAAMATPPAATGETSAQAADFGRMGVNPAEFGLHAPPAAPLHAPPVPTGTPIDESNADVAASDPNAALGLRDGEEWLARNQVPTGESAPSAPAATVPAFDSSELDSAFKDHEAATQRVASIESDLAARQAVLQDRYNAQITDIAKKHYDAAQGLLGKQQALIDDLAAHPVQRKDMGIGAAIALAFGAFGAALTKTPNFALEIINKKIDDDLAVQKANRAEKNNLINTYMQQGLSLENAYKLAKADKLAEVEGHIKAAALQSGSQQHLAMADAASAKFKMDRMKLVAEAAKSHFDAVTAPLTWQANMAHAKSQTDLANAQAARQYAETSLDYAKATSGKSQQAVEGEYLSGIPVPIAHRALLSKDAREAAVQIGGNLFAAHDAEAAKKARAASSAAEELATAVKKMRAFREGPGRAFAPGTSATADALQRTAQLAVKAAGDLGTLDSGSQAFLDSLVKNPGAIFTNDATIAASLDALDGWGESRKQAVLGAQLVNPPMPRAAKIRPGG